MPKKLSKWISYLEYHCNAWRIFNKTLLFLITYARPLLTQLLDSISYCKYRSLSDSEIFLLFSVMCARLLFTQLLDSISHCKHRSLFASEMVLLLSFTYERPLFTQLLDSISHRKHRSLFGSQIFFVTFFYVCETIVHLTIGLNFPFQVS